jgi:hypothetical protein
MNSYRQKDRAVLIGVLWGCERPLKSTSEWLRICERPYCTAFLIKRTWANERSKGVEGGHILDMSAGNEGLSPRGDRPLSQTGDSRNDVTFSLRICTLSVVTAKLYVAMK